MSAHLVLPASTRWPFPAAALISIRRGRSVSGFGTRSVSTPSDSDASIASGSSPPGTRRLRSNRPNPAACENAPLTAGVFQIMGPSRPKVAGPGTTFGYQIVRQLTPEARAIRTLGCGESAKRGAVPIGRIVTIAMSPLRS
jgi:hypothetical protein